MRKAKRPLLSARWACLRAQALLVARSIAALAQLVEHRIRNAGVRCSSHLSGTIFSNTLDFPARAEMRFASGLGLEVAPVAAVVFSA